MHPILLSMMILINISFLFAMPYPDNDDFEIAHLVKRFQIPPWVNKRNPALCDYRLQLRPLPFSSALCAYG
jgi:hypothetical protein